MTDAAERNAELTEQRMALANGEDIPPEFSDDALADAFSEAHQGELRHVAPWNRWMIWTGCRWRPEVTHLAFDLARAICRAAASDARRVISGTRGERIAVAVASAKTVAAVERMARTDRRHTATPDQWDNAPHLIATPWRPIR